MGSGRRFTATTRSAADTAIDIICTPPDALPIAHADRFLFSIAHQSIHSLQVTIVLGHDGRRDLERLVDMFDWHRFPRKPLVLRHADGAASRTASAVGLAEHRFVGFTDMRGTFYERGCQLLMETALESRAAVAYGDAVIKDVQVSESFIYERKRHYREALPSERAGSRADMPLPLGAFLFDRARIAPADLRFDPPADFETDPDFVSRLLARYPARRVERRIPVFAHDRDVMLQGAAPRRYAPRSSDHLMRALRELRRKRERLFGRLRGIPIR